MKHDTYGPLLPLVLPHVDKNFRDLPDAVQRRVAHEYIGGWDQWDVSQRESIAKQCDMQNDQKNGAYDTHDWYDETLQASTWWRIEIVPPSAAIMLLTGRKPNQSEDYGMKEARYIENDCITPHDFSSIEHTINGASTAHRTLRDWYGYATQKNLKIHPWLGEWVAHEDLCGNYPVPGGQTSTANFIDEATVSTVDAKSARFVMRKFLP